MLACIGGAVISIMGVYRIHVESYSRQKDFKTYRLHHLVKPSLLLAQCFALLPIVGVTSEESKVQFKWLSFRTFYTISTVLLLSFYSICVFIYTAINNDNFFSFVVVVWNVRGVLGIILFFRIGRRWSNLIKLWKSVECSMCNYGPLPYLKLKFRILSIVLLLTGISEHLLFLTGALKKLFKNVNSSENYVQKYFEEIYSEFFDIFEYAHWKAVIVEFVSLITTFQWQFSNYFVIVISLVLGERFQQISIKINTKQVRNSLEWKTIRQHYNDLTLLCKSVNDVIGELVMLVFSGNLYFLSISVLQCLTPRYGFDLVYFWYGMIFTLFHFCVVCWYASWVYEESLEPITELASTCTKNLSHEIDRLLYQMASRDISISGCGFFQIKRSSFLSMISTLVTIELIFLQFNTNLGSNISI